MGGQVDYIKGKIRSWSAVLYAVQKASFNTLYAEATEEQKKVIDQCIFVGDAIGLKEILKELNKNNLEGYSVDDLRRIAANYKISDYIYLTKAQLIFKIRRYRKGFYHEHT